MKKQFTKPEIDVIKLNEEEIVLTASTGDIDVDPWENDDIGNG